MTANFKNLTGLFYLLTLSFFLRLAAIYYYGDISIDNEWSTLLENLSKHKTLSFRSFDGILIPSVYMPPLYAFFLYFVKFFSPENILFVNSVLFVQLILSTLSVYFFFKLNSFFFTKKWSLFNSFLLSIFPLTIYATTQISSVTLQFFLLIIFLYLFFCLYKNKKRQINTIILFSLVSGLLMLLRGEFFLILFVSLVYLLYFKKLNFKKILAIFLVSLLVISPYLVRNYNVFNKITLTKSLGYNLWKGNNPFATVEGAENIAAFTHNNIDKKIQNLPKDKLYDFHYDKMFLIEGINYIEKNILVFISAYIKKALSFFYFNISSDYPKYYHPLFIFPIAITSVFSTIGIFISFKKINFEKGFLLLYLLINILIFSNFFILPRYKMIILPIQLIFMNYFLLACSKKISFLNKLFNNKYD